MSEIWKQRLKKILFWLSGAVCGAGGSLGLQQPIQSAACVVNELTSPIKKEEILNKVLK